MLESIPNPRSLTPIPILFVTTFADRVGGGQNSLLLLLAHLDRKKYKPFLWTPAEGEMKKQAARMGVSSVVACMPRLRTLLFDRQAGVGVFIKKHNIAIVHCDDPSTAAWLVLNKNRLDVKVVFHARVSDAVFFDRVLEFGCDAVIAVSKSAARRFAHAKVVYNSADLSVMPSYPMPREDGTLHLGYFGRIHPRKGLAYLIDACKQLSYLRLHIFGAGEARYVQKLEERTSGAPIAWYGHLADVRDAMNRVDCVVLPAIENEGLSRMLIEAMALGKAVVGTDIAANAELFGDALSYALCRQRSVAALVDAIERVCGRGVIEVGQAARARAEEVLDVKKNTRLIEAVYEELLR
jgi:glycosyltransferase involved in cell wall biosynthesis